MISSILNQSYLQARCGSVGKVLLAGLAVATAGSTSRRRSRRNGEWRAVTPTSTR